MNSNRDELALVSICIPTYNRLNLLKQAVESGLNQTYLNFEIVIADNSENDETKNWIVQLNHPKIRYFKNKENLGGILNICRLIELARGESIKFLMDDDLLLPNCLEKMQKHLDQDPSIGVVMAPLKIISESGDPISPRFYGFLKKKFLYVYRTGSELISGEQILFDFLTSHYPCCVPTGLLIRKKCFDQLGTFDTSTVSMIDVEICMRFALRFNFYYMNEALTKWRFSEKSDSVTQYKHGYPNEVFYNIAEKYLLWSDVKLKLARYNWNLVQREAYLFATQRCLLSLIAAVSQINLILFMTTLKTIWRREKYLTNILKLPFRMGREILVLRRRQRNEISIPQ